MVCLFVSELLFYLLALGLQIYLLILIPIDLLKIVLLFFIHLTLISLYLLKIVLLFFNHLIFFLFNELNEVLLFNLHLILFFFCIFEVFLIFDEHLQAQSNRNSTDIFYIFLKLFFLLKKLGKISFQKLISLFLFL